MDEELEEFADIHGNIRKCGSLLPPEGFVSSFTVFEESEHPLYDNADIDRIISNSVDLDTIFGPEWIMNQKSHGSCNGFAGAGALSVARRLRGFTDNLLLSGAYLYSKINGGRDNGSALEAGLRAIQKYGCPPQSLVPWNMIYPHQQPRNADEEAAKHKGFKCYAVQTKQGFRSALAAGFPVIVAVHAGRGYQSSDNNGIARVDNGRGNHAVYCRGIKKIAGKEVYPSPGSWGLSLGKNGVVQLPWESFEQTFKYHTFYAVASTEES